MASKTTTGLGLFTALLLYTRLILSVKPHSGVIGIGVDNPGFLAVALAGLDKRLFLSHELSRDALFWLCQRLGISNLAIQSEVRKNYLLGCSSKTRTWLLPNSIVYKGYEPDWSSKAEDPGMTRLLYVGNVISEHSVESMIGSLYDLERTSLCLHGSCSVKYEEYLTSAFSDLFESGRLWLSRRYLEPEALVRFASGFDIGLCLYSLDKCRSDFNYASSPSGKIFIYANAGIPVIGSKIVGLQDIVIHGFGTCISNNSSDEISEATKLIQLDYRKYATSAMNYARNRCFAKYADEILEHALSST